VRRCGDRLDWDEIVRRACQFRWAPAVDAALTGARERFGTPILPRPSLRCEPRRTRRRPRSSTAAPRPTRPASLALAGIAGLSWPARLRYLQALVLPAPDYVAGATGLGPPGCGRYAILTGGLTWPETGFLPCCAAKNRFSRIGAEG